MCDEVLGGSPFFNDPSGRRISTTDTVVDSLITAQVLDASTWNYSQWFERRMDVALVFPYQQWVQANRPELEEELFADFAFLRMTPDNVETHRQLIAEWRAEG